MRRAAPAAPAVHAVIAYARRYAALSTFTLHNAIAWAPILVLMKLAPDDWRERVAGMERALDERQRRGEQR
jgi:hypothetical protein